jgi:CHAT domain-containing protein
MARFFLCLCLVLTLSMDGSRWAADIRTGSSRTGFWWGTRELQQLNLEASRLRAAGDFAGAERLYERQLELARRTHDNLSAVRSLQNIGGTRALQHRYRSALEPMLEARRLARLIRDRLDLGAADFNLSSLYLQMWDVDAALAMAEEGVAVADPINGPPAKTYYRHLALLHLGRLHQMLDDGRAVELFQKGIEAAREQGDDAQEAVGWDLLGEEYFRHQRLADSERALDEAFRIRTFRCTADLPFSYARLGELKLAQGDLASADRLTSLAIASGTKVQSKFPAYILEHQQGSIRLAQGDTSGAIEEFRAAVDHSSDWRREILPASSILNASNSELEKRVFDSFVETAAHQAIKTGDARLVRESFQALEWNRAESLRQAVGLAAVWREKLPSNYWDTLGELRQEQARALRGHPSIRRDQLSLKLTEMEAEAGLPFFSKQNENFRTQSSLILLRKGLSNSDLLVSFYLGGKESYVWALTRQSLHLYPLAAAPQIRSKIEEFRKDIRDGRLATQTGTVLYDHLFSQLNLQESGKTRWLLSLDDALFEAPLAALRHEGRYLVESHTLKVLPGALWSADETGLAANGWFLGVGDPIYNTADPRWNARSRPLLPWVVQAASDNDSNDGLNRLVASGSEVESSAQSFAGQGVILRGADALREKFVTLAGRNPAVIHLATHVLTPSARRGEAMIAFGLGPSGATGYLTTADVAMLHVPGAIVSMTGCETGGGEASAGAGLVGLTRAWQIAGATAVVSTLWPVRDSAGDLFTSFYKRLPNQPAAAALRQSQIEMIESGTWRSEPRYWAAYQITGGRLAQ